MDREVGRKERSDKKKEVKPLIPIDLKDTIYRLSYITHTPVKDVSEKLCIAVIKDPRLISDLSQHFIRDIRIQSTIYIGNVSNPRISKRLDGDKERVTIKFIMKDYNIIYDLGYALDCRPARVVALLLEIALKDIKIVNQYIKDHLESEVSQSQMKELRNIMRYINTVNNSNHSWAALLSQIVDEVGPFSKIKDAIIEFLK